MTTYQIMRALRRAGVKAYEIRGGDVADLAWRHLDREDSALHSIEGWPACECCSDWCDDPATTTDDGGNAVCAACVDYACDEDGQPHCAAHDPHVRDEGEWTGGGDGTPTGYRSCYVYRQDDDAS